MTDVEQIRQALARYWQYLDDRREREWVELFDDDDILLQYQSTVARSRGDLDAIAGDLKNHAGGKHVSSNEIVDVDGEHASAHSDVMFLAPAADGSVNIAFYGRCDDTLRRTGSVWRFTSRVIRFQGGYHA
jgi:3-phenylpropionate/cinnamic acid dioxygenase small subunit